ncbi:hypothetical protein FPOAC1_007730 [Fusarium poae]|uniref:hypothetical protein n=1 Tax=Fusarium poae TaxID=36050 RepID=UPI001CE7BDBC|nr:hypothetical protein FPOAC1_007730 [Fusarium poae]KAG8668351.1 hypothetical protein FPOAC1_007730 [Fusarium poae]
MRTTSQLERERKKDAKENPVIVGIKQVYHLVYHDSHGGPSFSHGQVNDKRCRWHGNMSETRTNEFSSLWIHLEPSGEDLLLRQRGTNLLYHLGYSTVCWGHVAMDGQLREICIFELIKMSWHQPFNHYAWVVERDVQGNDMAYHSNDTPSVARMQKMLSDEYIFDSDAEDEDEVEAYNIDDIAQEEERVEDTRMELQQEFK